MTSANAGGEPICLGNREALVRLDGLADAWLLHDRDILVRVDDSVATLQPRLPAPGVGAAQAPGQLAEPLFYRRARGYVPRPVFLPESEADAPCVMGTGAELKATACLTRGREAFVGQHIGDLENPATLAFYEEVAAHLEALLEVRPAALVCDAHPDFLSTRYAEARAARDGLPLWRLQHHAAHAASVLAENGHYGPALALCLDGTGLGDDGTVWGGELLFMKLARPQWRRLGRLAPFALPGGDAAVRQPWRIALALRAQCASREPPTSWPAPWLPEQQPAATAIEEMLRRNLNCPLTSSCGRLFDAVAAQLGLCLATSYEGQAAIRLEDAAGRASAPLRAALEGRAMTKQDGKYSLGTRLDLPTGATVFNCIWMPGGKDGKGDHLIMLTDDERIKVFQGHGNTLVHTTMERYSGSATGMDHYKGMPGLGVDKNYQLPSKYYAPMRFIAADIGNTGHYTLLINKPISTAAQFFDRYRFFPQGEVHALYWDGVGLGLKWKTRRIRGSVAEIDLADVNNDGVLDLVVGLNTSPDLGIGSRQCMITAYPLDVSATNPNAPADLSDFEVNPN